MKTILILAFGVQLSAFAQMQQSWVRTYNNGITNGQHQATAMALDFSGNLIVCGYSQNASSNFDYAVIKYAPNGNQIWVSRFSTNVSSQPAGFVQDKSGNLIVTGTGGTVKWNSNGVQQ